MTKEQINTYSDLDLFLKDNHYCITENKDKFEISYFIFNPFLKELSYTQSWDLKEWFLFKEDHKEFLLLHLFCIKKFKYNKIYLFKTLYNAPESTNTEYSHMTVVFNKDFNLEHLEGFILYLKYKVKTIFNKWRKN